MCVALTTLAMTTVQSLRPAAARTPSLAPAERTKLQAQYDKDIAMAKQSGWADWAATEGLLRDIKDLGQQLGLPPLDKGFEQQVLKRGQQLDLERGIHQ